MYVYLLGRFQWSLVHGWHLAGQKRVNLQNSRLSRSSVLTIGSENPYFYHLVYHRLFWSFPIHRFSPKLAQARMLCVNHISAKFLNFCVKGSLLPKTEKLSLPLYGNYCTGDVFGGLDSLYLVSSYQGVVLSRIFLHHTILELLHWPSKVTNVTVHPCHFSLTTWEGNSFYF